MNKKFKQVQDFFFFFFLPLTFSTCTFTLTRLQRFSSLPQSARRPCEPLGQFVCQFAACGGHPVTHCCVGARSSPAPPTRPPAGVIHQCKIKAALQFIRRHLLLPPARLAPEIHHTWPLLQSLLRLSSSSRQFIALEARLFLIFFFRHST